MTDKLTTRQVDKLIGVEGVLVDYFGDHSVVTISHRDRWHVYTTAGHKLDRSDIREFHPLERG